MSTNAGATVGFKQHFEVAGVVQTIRLCVPRRFRPSRLYVSESCAPFFEIVSVDVRLRSMMLNLEPIPCDVLHRISLEQEWDFPTLDAGEVFTMTAANTSGGAMTLRGAWFGYVKEGPCGCA